MLNNIQKVGYSSSTDIINYFKSIDWKRSVNYVKDWIFNNPEIAAISTLAFAALLTFAYIKRRGHRKTLANKNITKGQVVKKREFKQRQSTKISSVEKKARKHVKNGDLKEAVKIIEQVDSENEKTSLFATKIYGEVYKKRDLDLLIEYRDLITDEKAQEAVTAQICGVICSKISTLFMLDAHKHTTEILKLLYDKLDDAKSQVKMTKTILKKYVDIDKPQDIVHFVKGLKFKNLDDSQQLEIYQCAIDLLCIQDKYDDAEKLAEHLPQKKDQKILRALIETSKEAAQIDHLPHEQQMLVKKVKFEKLKVDLKTIETIFNKPISKAATKVKGLASTPYYNLFVPFLVKRCIAEAELETAADLLPNFTRKKKREHLYREILKNCKITNGDLVADCLANVQQNEETTQAVQQFLIAASHQDQYDSISDFIKKVKDTTPWLLEALLGRDTQIYKSVSSGKQFVYALLKGFELDETTLHQLITKVVSSDTYDMDLKAYLIAHLIKINNKLTPDDICNLMETAAPPKSDYTRFVSIIKSEIQFLDPYIQVLDGRSNNNHTAWCLHLYLIN